MIVWAFTIIGLFFVLLGVIVLKFSKTWGNAVDSFWKKHEKPYHKKLRELPTLPELSYSSSAKGFAALGWTILLTGIGTIFLSIF